MDLPVLKTVALTKGSEFIALSGNFFRILAECCLRKSSTGRTRDGAEQLPLSSADFRFPSSGLKGTQSLHLPS